MTYTVKVTQEQIDLGGHRANFCPVFRAMREAGIKVKTVMTDSFQLGDRPYISINLPPVVSIWVQNYDRFNLHFPNTTKPEPFEFVLDIPEVTEEQPV